MPVKMILSFRNKNTPCLPLRFTQLTAFSIRALRKKDFYKKKNYSGNIYLGPTVCQPVFLVQGINYDCLQAFLPMIQQPRRKKQGMEGRQVS